MASHESDGPVDWGALARRYWGAWAEVWRAPDQSPGAAGTDQGADPRADRALFEAWRDWLERQAAPSGPAAAGDWFAAMQTLAERFAGDPAGSGEFAAAWREQLRAQEAEWLHWLGEAGLAAWDPWLERVSRWISRWRLAAGPWLDLPGMGPGRNDHARWRRLAAAQQAYEEAARAYLAQLRQALDRGGVLFEHKLAERATAQPALDNVRDLFDLWIEAAEEAYAEVARSPGFQQVHADFVHAQMHLRLAVQAEVEHLGEPLGLPTRTEVDSLHRRLTALERELRQLRERLETPPASAKPQARTEGRRTAATADARPAATRRPRKRSDPS